jgi:hypothetical protein
VTPGQHRQVACEVAHRAGEVADRLLAFGDAVEIAHGVQRPTVAREAQGMARDREHGAKAYHEPRQRERDMISPDRPALDTPLARLCGARRPT